MSNTHNHIPRLTVTALCGGSGKTLVTLGLARALTLQGASVKTYKKGPDYIDAAWLSFAARTPQGNLDSFFSSPQEIQQLFLTGSLGHNLCLIEGNRGFFDGLDEHGSCSTAELARTLLSPVLLVLDCTKMTRTAAALVQACQNFEAGVHIGGVILNRIGSARHEQVITKAIHQTSSIPVLGALPRTPLCTIQESRFGLAKPQATDLPFLDNLAEFISNHCDLPALKRCAEAAAPLKASLPLKPSVIKIHPKVTIAYAHDHAFWLYYQENLDALVRAGARLIPFSLLDSAPIPACDGIYIGGCQPELYATSLSKDAKLKNLKELSDQHLPIYAEGTGILPLCTTLTYQQASYPMTGVFPGTISITQKAQALGYSNVTAVLPSPFHPQGLNIRAHEFHFTQYQPVPSVDTLCLRLSKGKGLCSVDRTHYDGLLTKKTFASYTQIYAPSVPSWANSFVAACSR